jgi:peptidoglycan/LPS O-acetylase OafA/YrhL
MFFGLSGFLGCGSALRLKRVSTFLTFRVLRLWLALLTEITLSALILGPLFTTLPLADYFSHPQTWGYFSNLIGLIKYCLPGVFETNGVSLVNGNLRTLPAEFDCYAIAALLMVTPLFYRRVAFTAIMVAVTLVLIPLNFLSEFEVSPMFVTDNTLVYYFLLGALFYMWRDRIPLRLDLFVASAVAGFLLLEFHHTVFMAPVFVTYCMVWMGMLVIPKLPLIKHGDYSYGIYLYGFPICQACVAVMPGLVGHRLAVFAVGGLFTCLFAAFSWHVIEKPSLRLKNALPARLFPPKAHVPGVLQEPAAKAG